MTDSKSPIEPLKESIGLRTEFIRPERSFLVVTQHRSWSGGDFTARAEDGTTILTSSGKWASKSARKEFKDASGLPLFNMKMSLFSMSSAWYLELPGGQRILSVKYKWSINRVKLDVTLKNAASPTHDEVVLKVKSQDSHLGSTQVLWQGRPVAVVRKKVGMFSITSEVTSEFEVEVAAGMDHALVSPCPSKLDRTPLTTYTHSSFEQASVITIVLAELNMLSYSFAIA